MKDDYLLQTRQHDVVRLPQAGAVPGLLGYRFTVFDQLLCFLRGPKWTGRSLPELLQHGVGCVLQAAGFAAFDLSVAIECDRAEPAAKTFGRVVTKVGKLLKHARDDILDQVRGVSCGQASFPRPVKHQRCVKPYELFPS